MQGGERSARVWTVFDWIMLKPLVWLLLHTSPEFEPWAGLRISLHIGVSLFYGDEKVYFYGILSDLLHMLIFSSNFVQLCLILSFRLYLKLTCILHAENQLGKMSAW